MTRWSVTLLLVLFLLGCGGEKKEEPKERVFEVRTMKVSFTEIPLSYTTTGFLEAVHRVEVRPEVSGRVVEVLAEEGDLVKEGDPLLRIDESVYRKAYEEALWRLREAEKDLENAKAVYERRKKLFEKELISEEEFEEIRTRLETLKARVKRLRASLERRRLELERTLVRSPVEGVVVSRWVDVGDYVTPQTKAYDILKLDPLRFVFKVPQELLPHLRLGKFVKVKVGSREIRAKVVYVSPTADVSRMFTVKAKVRNRKEKLRPNMYGEVSVETGRVKAVLVPEQAVRLSQRQTFLWVVRDSRAVKVPVRVVAHKEGLSAVTGELKEGDRVVVEGYMFLYEGAKVVER